MSAVGTASEPDPETPRRRGRPRRTPEQQAAQRSEMVRGVMAAIRSAGPDLTIDEMAAGAGVSKPVIYDMFGGRVGVADAIAVKLADDVEAAVLRHLAAATEIDAGTIIDTILDAFLTLVDTEQDLYAFIIGTMRGDSRGLLDTALVRVLHRRLEPVIDGLAPGLSPERLAILTDGLYGFVLASVESWQGSRRLDREAMVDLLGSVLRDSLGVAAPDLGRT